MFVCFAFVMKPAEESEKVALAPELWLAVGKEAHAKFD